MQLVDIDGDGFVRNWCNVDQLFGPMVPHWWTIEVPPSTERFQRSLPLATAGKRPWESRNVLVWECIVARRSKANLSVAPMWCFFQIVQTGCILRLWKHAALAQPIIEVIYWALMVQWPCPEAFVAGQRPDAVCRCWRCARTAWAMVVWAPLRRRAEACEVFWWIINGSMENPL